jgi:hypothetical protein
MRLAGVGVSAVVKPAAIAAGTGSDCTEGIPAAAAAKRVMSWSTTAARPPSPRSVRHYSRLYRVRYGRCGFTCTLV